MIDTHDCAQLLLDTLPGLMRNISGALRQRRSDDEPLTIGQFRIMEMLSTRSLSLSELAQCHYVTPSTMSRLIDVLARKEWVTRTAHPDDRRLLVIQLSDEGRAAHQTMLQQMHDAMARMIDQLDANDQATLLAGVQVLRKLLDQRATQAEPCHTH